MSGESGTPEAKGKTVSEKLYGAKCIRCGCIDHHGSEGLEADPIPWLEQRGMECARCTFCQERALSRAIQEAGLFIFAPEVREAVEMFKRGDTSHPITQSLRAECLAIEAEAESGTPEAILSAEEVAERLYSMRQFGGYSCPELAASHEALRAEVESQADLLRRADALIDAAKVGLDRGVAEVERLTAALATEKALRAEVTEHARLNEQGAAAAVERLTAERDERASTVHAMTVRAEAAEARIAALTEALRQAPAALKLDFQRRFLATNREDQYDEGDIRAVLDALVLGGTDTP